MHDPADGPKLVRRAIESGLSNCVEWIDDKTMLRVGNDPELQGLSPVAIKKLLCNYIVSNKAAIVEQRTENRPHWMNRRDYWYCVIVPVEGFLLGLFVEMELSDDDPDYPVVSLVNAHPQKS